MTLMASIYSDDCGSNADDEYATLEPTLTFTDSTPEPDVARLDSCGTFGPKSSAIKDC